MDCSKYYDDPEIPGDPDEQDAFSPTCEHGMRNGSERTVDRALRRGLLGASGKTAKRS